MTSEQVKHCSEVSHLQFSRVFVELGAELQHRLCVGGDAQRQDVVMGQPQYHLPHQLPQAPPSHRQTTPQHFLETGDGVQRRVDEWVRSFLDIEKIPEHLRSRYMSHDVSVPKDGKAGNDDATDKRPNKCLVLHHSCSVVWASAFVELLRC